jgi:signal transduction histidine kinase
MKLGSKLIVALVLVVIAVMAVHGYLSIRQDTENIEREIRIGMRGSARSIQIALGSFYREPHDRQGLASFVDTIFPRGNIHGLAVYDLSGRLIASSESLRSQDAPQLDPDPILRVDPGPVLLGSAALDGYIRSDQLFIYYRTEPIFDAARHVVGAFVLARHGGSLTGTIQARRSRIIITTVALVVLLSALILIIVHRSVTRPINGLIIRVREIASGRRAPLLEKSGRDEIAMLAREFSLMWQQLQKAHLRVVDEQQEKLNLERDLRHSERLASVGRLAAGLAHEIGTPLNIISGRAEFLLRRRRTAEELNDNLNVIRSQSDRIAGIVRQLLEFARRKEPVFRMVSLPALLSDVQNLLRHHIEERGIGVSIQGAERLPPFRGDPEMLQQVFLNLFTNSFHAMRHGGAIKIAAGMAAVSAVEERIWITFEDNGAGILPDHVERVFDPFFTTKDVGEGSGLGLAVSYGIIKDHGGEIRVQSEPGIFTRFIIELPADGKILESARPALAS